MEFAYQRHDPIGIAGQVQRRFGVYYEWQERAFEGLSDDELEEQGITQYKAIELVRLARTYLPSDGDLDKFSRFREVFEDDRIYATRSHKVHAANISSRRCRPRPWSR